MGRLSSLPPELLSVIFDLAHDPEQPLREPLSKTLLPYFRQTFYRRIRITSLPSLLNLLSSLQNNSSLGDLVHSIDTSTGLSTLKLRTTLKAVLRLLPALRTITTPLILSLYETFYSFCPPQLPLLTSLSYSCQLLPRSDLELLSQIRHLKILEIRFREYDQGQGSNSSNPLDLVGKLSLYCIRKCTLDFPCSWTREFALFVKHFSRITSLSLRDDALPDYRHLLDHLNCTSIQLKALTLNPSSDFSGVEDDIACDHLLPRFQSLQHLDLGAATVSPQLHIYLRQLPQLSYLRLGRWTHLHGPRGEDVLSLVKGPYRINTLKTLIIDSVKGKIGRRVDLEDVGKDWVDLHVNGWEIPYLEHWEIQGLEQLVEAASDSGVELSGDTFEAISIQRAVELELANRLILYVQRTKSFECWLSHVKAGIITLPELDVDELDPENLKLVKIDLPEEGWFQFTLE
ncbi:hypothetical protein JCM5350_003926 [Sporobolomyces pararoseus]